MAKDNREEKFYVPLQDIEDRMRVIQALLVTLPVELAALRGLLPAARQINLGTTPAAENPPKP